MRPISLLLFSPLALAAVLRRDDSTSQCTNPSLRREWRQLNAGEQQSYIDAVLCLKTKPSKLGLDTARYDDFPYVHNLVNNDIHFVASFLPWHRYFLHLYETALKEECGYAGTAVYWDWTLDVANVPNSPVFLDSAFGGNGSWFKPITLSDGTTRRCVNDGRFADLVFPYYGAKRENHCLMRSFNAGSETVGDMLAKNYSPSMIATIQELKTYDEYRQTLEGTPHGAIHSCLGGDMMPSTSPNDPLFFLHHAQIDRLWWSWQEKDPKNYEDYSGWKTQDKRDGTAPPPAQKEDVMEMRGLAEDTTVAEFMTTVKSGMCYRY